MAQIIGNNPVIWRIRIFKEKDSTGGIIAPRIDFVTNHGMSYDRFDFVRCQGGDLFAIAPRIDFVTNHGMSDNRFDFVGCQGGNAVTAIGR